MDEIIGINYNGIRVTNLSTARRFHEELGYEFIVEPVGPESVAIMLPVWQSISSSIRIWE